MIEISMQARIDALRKTPVQPGRLLIGGRWIAGAAGDAPVTSPIDGSLLTTIAAGDAGDGDAAVAAARRGG